MSLRRFYYLGQDPAGRTRMDEGDAGIADADAGLVIDQLEAGVLELVQDLFDVADRIGDVMQAGAALLQVLPNRCVRAQRLQELDVAVADVEQRGLDALRLHRLAVGERHAEGLLVEGEGALEVVGGDADVVDSAEHGPGSLRSRERIPGRALAAARLLLDTEDLPQRGHPDLQLLRGWLLGGDQPLDLVAGPVECPGCRGAGVALAPGEHLRRDRRTGDADRRPSQRAGLLEGALEQ